MIEIFAFYKLKKLNRIKTLRKIIFNKIFENNVKGLVIISIISICYSSYGIFIQENRPHESVEVTAIT